MSVVSGDLDVALPSGASFTVMNQEERAYLQERVRRYGEDNTFVNISDQQDLDGVLTLELLRQRWTRWLGIRTTYDGGKIDEARLRQDVAALSRELRQLKKTLGIDKPARDRARGEGSVAQRWAALAHRAKLMGIMRNDQAIEAITLSMRLFGMITFSRNLETDEERREMKATNDDIIEWVWDKMRARILEIDRKFRQDGPEAQKLWMHTQ